MSAGKTDCPVCGKDFDKVIISHHVNDCLNGTKNVEVDNTRKRKQSDWDFLTRRSNSHVPNSNWSDRSSSSKRNDNGDGGGWSKKAKLSRNKKTKKTHTNVAANDRSSKTLTRNERDSSITNLNGESVDDSSSRSSDIEFVREEINKTETETDKTKTSPAGGEDSRLQIQNEIRREIFSNKIESTQKASSIPATLLKLKTMESSPAINRCMQRHTSSASASTSSSASIAKAKLDANKPLAEKARPTDIRDYVGQENVLGKRSLLHSILQQGDNIPSMILWGPPGCGKTTLAKIIAQRCREQSRCKFVHMSATSATVNDVKEAAKLARNDLKMLHRKTILFLDEVHRFNKLQQDVLLPHVEDGTLTLIGATTENPSFHVNSALLSRCRLVTLEKLKIEDIKRILRKALSQLNAIEAKDSELKTKWEEASDSDQHEHQVNEESSQSCRVETSALDVLAGLVDGDARAALNALQLAVEGRRAAAQSDGGEIIEVSVADIKEGLQKSHVLYDKTGEEHYNTVSALIKSMRGSDANAALYWLARMLEGGENPMFIVRRLVIFASEDVGLADPSALTQAVSTYHACHFIGMPECAINLSQCVVYLARAPKSVETYRALEAARACVREGPRPPVPLHLRNPTNSAMKALGYGKNYKYPPDHPGGTVQEYFPTELVGTDFFKH